MISTVFVVLASAAWRIFVYDPIEAEYSNCLSEASNLRPISLEDHTEKRQSLLDCKITADGERRARDFPDIARKKRELEEQKEKSIREGNALYRQKVSPHKEIMEKSLDNCEEKYLGNRLENAVEKTKCKGDANLKYTKIKSEIYLQLIQEGYPTEIDTMTSLM